MIRRIQLTLLALFVGVWAMASETSVKNADGVEIWYDFDSSAKTASVTYKGESYSTFSDEYTGEVVIPSRVTYEGEEYSVTKIGRSTFFDCNSLTSITLPESVTEIGDNAFRSCSSLTSITIPEGVTSIGARAFCRCNSLTNVTIPESVTSIGDYAFFECSSLTSTTIPDGVTSIGDFAFYYCDYLTNITIPKSVTEIGDNAFSFCYRLYEVCNKSNLTITAGSSDNGYVAYYAKNVYTDKSGESKLKVVGDYIFYVDEDNIELFVYLGDETSITLPSNCEGKNYKIGSYAFYSCTDLTSITLPKSVTWIGSNAFSGCSSLISITSVNATPPSINYDSFFGVDYFIPVYVPKQSVEAYKSAEYWKDFTNIQGIDDTPISDVVADSVSIRLIGNSLIVEGAESYAVYALSGQCLGKVESLERGVYIVVADGVSKKIVVK